MLRSQLCRVQRMCLLNSLCTNATKLWYHSVASSVQTGRVSDVKRKVGLVGVGHVGAAAGYAMSLHRACDELVLLDSRVKKAVGEATDLRHCQGQTGKIGIKAGDYRDLAGCDIVVVSAGAAQKIGETRLDLLCRNAEKCKSIITLLDQHAPDATVIVVTNPVDIMTYVMQRFTKRPISKVIGTGTMIDTARFRTLIGDYYDTDPRSVHGYVLGEHGDSQMVAWSTVCIGGQKLIGNVTLGKSFDPIAMEKLAKEVKNSGAYMLERKGHTNWAIGLCIAELVQAMLEGKRSVIPLSVRLTGQYGIDDVCLSLPSRVGHHEVEAADGSLPLLPKEVEMLASSASMLRSVTKELGLD